MPTRTKPGLESWKEIARYLDIEVRTAQRWEKDMGLPVHREPDGKRRVVAYPTELDRWRQQAFHGPRWYSSLRFLRSYAVLATAAILLGTGIVIGLYINVTRLGPPTGYRIDYRTLMVTDGAGRELWRHTFPQPLLTRMYSEHHDHMQRVWFGNLDSDAGVETIFSYWPTTVETDGTLLVCFDDAGAVAWTYRTRREVADQHRTFLPIYCVTDFRVEDIDQDRAPEILATIHQLDSHPTQFVVLNAEGQLEQEYWHSGHLPYLVTADIDADGTADILLGGVNNGRQSAVLVILDPANVSGASRQPEGDPFQLQGFGLGTERAYVVFPRTCINRPSEQYNLVTGVTADENLIVVKVAEQRLESQHAVIYTLDNDLAVTHIRWADMLKDLHRAMEARGELDHTLTEEEIERMKRLTIIR